jgi:hypothetical protein
VLKRLFSYYIASEVRPMLSLAIPLVMAELGWKAMGVVDATMALQRKAIRCKYDCGFARVLRHRKPR